MFNPLYGVAAVLLLASQAASAEPDDATWPAGHWRGSLDLGGQKLEIIYHLQISGEGASGTMDVPAQGATGLPLQSVGIEGDRLTIEMPLAGKARFDGRRTEGMIEGTFVQAGQSFALTLERVDAAPRPVRPQEPEDPLPYQAEELFFEGAGATRLGGTLTLPDSSDPVSGVVLVAGAGPHDRDGTFMNHRPLLVLADQLTRAGLAVLRFDERGVGRSEGEFAPATGEQLAEDIAAAVNTLRGHESVDGRQVGIVAHSEGGRISALAVKAHDAADFLVLLGAPARPGIKSLRAQAQQSSNPVIRLQAAMAEATLQVDAGADAEPALRLAAEEMLAGLDTPQRDMFGGREDTLVDQLVQALGQPQARFSLAFNPGAALRQANVPVLALYGEKDRQIDAAGAAQALQEALDESAEVWTLPGLNHFFQQAETGAPSEYSSIEQTLAPQALEKIIDWLKAVTGHEP